MIIKALLEKSTFTIWMDPSVQWQPDIRLHDVFERTSRQGMLIMVDRSRTIAQRTASSMMHFYGYHSCQFEPYGEVEGKFFIFHNEPFMRDAVLAPWLACALDRRCMCVEDGSMGCQPGKSGRTPICHRFDRSSLGVIVSSLYQDRLDLVEATTEVVRTDHKYNTSHLSFKCS